MENENTSCFVIMPISECEGYETGHFNHVYEDIIKPAIEAAGYKAERADEVKETNLIHLDILKKLIDAPIAICDLSTRNPNVLFELGIRQAFDKPVVLIQEKGTPKIFDIAPLRYHEYSKEMKYHEVIGSQKELKDAILATKDAAEKSDNINSIVKLMSLSSAASMPTLDKKNEQDLKIDFISSQLNEMKHLLLDKVYEDRRAAVRYRKVNRMNYEQLETTIENILVSDLTKEDKKAEFNKLLKQLENPEYPIEPEAQNRLRRRILYNINQLNNFGFDIVGEN